MTTPAATTLRKIDARAPLGEIMAIYREDGAVILEGVLTPDEVRQFNEELAPGVDATKPAEGDDEFLVAFLGANTKRLDAVINSTLFREQLLDLDIVHNLSEQVFLEESGDYWMATSQIIEIGPNSAAQPLHRDNEVWPLFRSLGPSGPEATINFIVALTEFTEENGATRAIPGSQNWADYENRGTPEQTIPVLMNSGDALFMSGKVAHGGGANVTTDKYRRGLSFGICASYLVGEEAYGLILDKEDVRHLPRRVQSILGFRSHYPKDSYGIWQGNYQDIGDYLGL